MHDPTKHPVRLVVRGIPLVLAEVPFEACCQECLDGATLLYAGFRRQAGAVRPVLHIWCVPCARRLADLEAGLLERTVNRG